MHLQKTIEWQSNHKHEFDTFTHVKGLLYKHITDWQTISFPGYAKILEVHSLSESP